MALLALCLAPGCPGQDRTASFPIRERIPLGVLEVSVEGREDVGQSHAPLSSLRAPEGEKAMAVFVAWSGLEDYAEPDRQLFVEAFLEGRLRLVDSGGFDYEPVSAMPREIYLLSGHSGRARDWVVVFHVPVGSRAHTLRVRRPDSAKAEFDVAIVPLG